VHELTSDIVPPEVQRGEVNTRCMLYLEKAKAAYSTCTQVHIACDPSQHHEETLVSIVYSHQVGVAAVPAIQVVPKVHFHELEESLAGLMQERRLKRLAAYGELRAVDSALRSLGLGMETFKTPPSIICRPLKAEEIRVKCPITGRFKICSTSTGEWVDQVPQTVDLSELPLLVAWMDQGSVGTAAMHYVVGLGHQVHLNGEKFHRVGASDCLTHPART